MPIVSLWRSLAEIPDEPLPACTADACRQSRKTCPCPDACRLHQAESLGTTLVAAGLLLAVAAFIVLTARGLLPGDEPAPAASALTVAAGASR